MAFPILDPDHPLLKSPGYEYERDRFGSLKTEVLHIPLSELNIIFRDKGGRLRTIGHDKEGAESKQGIGQEEAVTYIRTNGFEIRHPKIDPMLVRSCEIRLHYEDEWIACAKIEVYVGKKIEPTEENPDG